jgi:hypothetical protein
MLVERVWDSVASQGTHRTQAAFATYVTSRHATHLVELKSSGAGGWIQEGSSQVDSEGSISQVG